MYIWLYILESTQLMCHGLLSMQVILILEVQRTLPLFQEDAATVAMVRPHLMASRKW